MNYKLKTAQGIIWVSALQVTNQLLSFVKNVVLARLLSPKDFGFFGLALLIISFVDVLSTTGLKSALIQKKQDIDSYINTAWTVEFIRGALIAVIILSISPIAMRFLGLTPQSRTEIIVFGSVGIALFFQAVTAIISIDLERNLLFSKYFFYQIGGSIVDLCLCVIFAYLWRNAYALILGFVSGHFVRFIGSKMLIRRKLKFEFKIEKVKRLMGFGKWIFLSNLFSFVLVQADSIVVSKFLGVTNFGLYQMGRTISNMPMQQVSGIIGTVAFPLLSRSQESKGQMEIIFIKLLRLVLFFLIPLTVFISLYSTEIVLCVLGEKWKVIIKLLPVMIFGGIIRPISSIFETFFCASNLPKKGTLSQIIRFVSFIVVLYPLIKTGGMLGVAYSVLIGNFAGLMYLLFTSIFVFKINFTKIAISFLIPVFLSVGCMLCLKVILSKMMVSGITGLILTIGLIIVSYSLGTMVLNRFSNYKVWTDIKGLVQASVSK